ncbi:phospholipase A [Psychrobacter sp. 16-MNA-CIBAN-0192]|uniref:phospholipase A n=1 Tax=Psychrobacter sp. 16-MNA-CIBAN-0192 TaxID=3140448 RepID=UPI0033312332
MFAHTFSPQRRAIFQGTPTYLTVSIGVLLSCATVSAQAITPKTVQNTEFVEPAVTIAQTSAIKASMVNKRAKYPEARVDNNLGFTTDEVAAQKQLFIECTHVLTDGARLACFDKVANQGITPSYITAKQPLDLAKTLKSTISGSPQVVLAENMTSIDDSTIENTKTVVVASQSVPPQHLHQGAPKTEAEILESVGVTQNDIEKYTPLSLAYDLDKNSERGTWSARPHRPMYLLPIFVNSSPNRNPSSPTQDLERPYTSDEMRNAELKLQVSIKTKVAEDLFGTQADMWFAYSQLSHWQVYNEDNSRPFRATDYEPEIFITQPVKANLPFGGRLRMLGVGASHHSNGQSDPLSRSWNRAYLMAGAEWGKFSVVPRLWTRINTDSNSESDDNPDIEDFMGYGDVTFLYDFPNKQSISGTLRYNPKTENGAMQVDYVYPLSNNVNGYIQLFRGYGESIIDYNHKNTGVGIGIMLNDWKGL